MIMLLLITAVLWLPCALRRGETKRNSTKTTRTEREVLDKKGNIVKLVTVTRTEFTECGNEW